MLFKWINPCFVGGHGQVVELLLKFQGIEIGIRNKDGATPLSLAKNDSIGSLLYQFSSNNASAINMMEHDEDDDWLTNSSSNAFAIKFLTKGQ